ncbi:hypothetical protein HK100_004886 [Physocladia obscura]|uniref:Gamma-soluble NSF attachment protein n=1 Tax=Physocladia obscura TaxID=109957 RepID=A0AAD5SUU5_9FUNG|nr:hypothetical protein HK100_004886 [Physocladia obscura]
MEKKSFFGKPNPDYDGARPLFEQAALQFRNAKAYEYAVEALTKAAECYSKQDALYLAGKHIETAAVMQQTNGKNPKDAARLFKQAADIFVSHGSEQKAAECLEKAAKGLETVDVDLAINLYVEACEIYDSDDKPRSGVDTIGRFISLLVRSKRWPTAIEYSERLVDIWKRVDNIPSFNKQALATVIIVLSSGDSVEARKRVLTYEQSRGFYDSEEGEICHQLVESYENYDEEQLANILKRQQIKYLDNQIALAAQSLRIPGSGKPAAPQNTFNPVQKQQQYMQNSQLPQQQFQGYADIPQQNPYAIQGFQPRAPSSTTRAPSTPQTISAFGSNVSSRNGTPPQQFGGQFPQGYSSSQQNGLQENFSLNQQQQEPEYFPQGMPGQQYVGQQQQPPYLGQQYGAPAGVAAAVEEDDDLC